MAVGGTIRRIEDKVDQLLERGKPLWPIPRILLHCWHEQRLAVECVFPAPQIDIHSVYDTLSMSGIESGGLFVEVFGHPRRVPPDVHRKISQDGWTVITIDDSAALSRARKQ